MRPVVFERVDDADVARVGGFVDDAEAVHLVGQFATGLGADATAATDTVLGAEGGQPAGEAQEEEEDTGGHKQGLELNSEGVGQGGAGCENNYSLRHPKTNEKNSPARG